PPAKQAALLALVLALYRGGRDLIKSGLPLASVSALACLPEILRARTEYAGDDLAGLAKLAGRLAEELEALSGTAAGKGTV
ncbi:MAG: hypothetical protein Q8O90_00670, partial [Elusimicrobiota bacterium]|nr:hypothetical protein [Elusimicrobiota bacterium]